MTKVIVVTVIRSNTTNLYLISREKVHEYYIYIKYTTQRLNNYYWNCWGSESLLLYLDKPDFYLFVSEFPNTVSTNVHDVDVSASNANTWKDQGEV